MVQRFDLDAYLARIGYVGPREPTRAVLDAAHACHLTAIPFENLDVRLGRPISLDLAALQEKLVGGGRGGYCFEQNALFAEALRALGFRVHTLEARVRSGGGTVVLPRTHMTLAVELPQGKHLADVGFGTDGPLWSVPFGGAPSEQPGGAWRVFEEGVLQRRTGAGWTDLYAFRPEPVLPIDFEVANHYTSTWPRSRFVQTATAQWTTAEARHTLRGRTYTRATAQGEDTRRLPLEEIAVLLRGFGLRVSDAEVRVAVGPTIVPASDQALLVRFGHEVSVDLQQEVWRLVRALRASPPPGLLDLHPGYGTLLVRYDPRVTEPIRLEEAIQVAAVPRPAELQAELPVVEVPVVYGGEDGPDLPAVAAESGMSESAVVSLHSGAEYRVFFLGFTAGFPYLAGLPDALSVARLPQPRRTVPEGSVAIAGRQAGIYPRSTPGGWRILGRTSLRLFTPERDPITLLRAGQRVRFVPLTSP